MREIFNYTKWLRRDEGGNIAIIAALSIIPIIMAMGLGIDLQRLVAGKMRMQASVDGALLSETGRIYAEYAQEVEEAKNAADRINRRQRRALQQSQQRYRRSYQRGYTRSARNRNRRQYYEDRRNTVRVTPDYPNLQFTPAKMVNSMKPYIKEAIIEQMPGFKDATITVRTLRGNRVIAKVKGKLPLAFGGFLGREEQEISVTSGVILNPRTGSFSLIDTSKL